MASRLPKRASELDGHEPVAAKGDSPVPGDRIDVLVAERLRRARHLKGMTLAEVAARVGVSHNFLSMVERGITDLSLSRFQRLATFYEIPASELLAEENGTDAPRIVTPADGLAIERGDGVSCRLLPNQEFGVQVTHATFEPGAGFKEPLSHDGADIVWVVKGRVTLVYGENEYTVRAGQCASYKATVPHKFVNRSKTQAEVIAISTSPYW